MKYLEKPPRAVLGAYVPYPIKERLQVAMRAVLSGERPLVEVARHGMEHGEIDPVLAKRYEDRLARLGISSALCPPLRVRAVERIATDTPHWKLSGSVGIVSGVATAVSAYAIPRLIGNPQLLGDMLARAAFLGTVMGLGTFLATLHVVQKHFTHPRLLDDLELGTAIHNGRDVSHARHLELMDEKDRRK